MIWSTIYNILDKYTSSEYLGIKYNFILFTLVFFRLIYGSLIDNNLDSLNKGSYWILTCFVILEIFAIIYMNVLTKDDIKQTSHFYETKINNKPKKNNIKNNIKKNIKNKSKENQNNKSKEIKTNILNDTNNDHIMLLKNDSDYIDQCEGFVKDSALGEYYNTNGNSNT